jgi:hypothetical protein
MEEKIEKKYSKLLVSKSSPENGCFVEEGGILIVVPKSKILNKDHIPHFFLDSIDRKTKSKYGWVKSIEPFTLDDFLKRYCSGSTDQDLISHIEIMLNSIVKLDDDTPVAATYSERGVESKRMEFTVHKVFFYKPK